MSSLPPHRFHFFRPCPSSPEETSPATDRTVRGIESTRPLRAMDELLKKRGQEKTFRGISRGFQLRKRKPYESILQMIGMINPDEGEGGSE